jgi:hypothetical protein
MVERDEFTGDRGDDRYKVIVVAKRGEKIMWISPRTPRTYYKFQIGPSQGLK